MILIISVCKERLHEYEFVNPIKTILQKEEKTFLVKHYSKLSTKDIESATKIIISGTSLQDVDYLNNPSFIELLKPFQGAILGICAGMQLLAILHGSTIQKEECLEIGMTHVTFEQPFLGISGEQQVYSLHQHGIAIETEGTIYATSKKSVQAARWKENHYGVLFHPEARTKQLLQTFANL